MNLQTTTTFVHINLDGQVSEYRTNPKTFKAEFFYAAKGKWNDTGAQTCEMAKFARDRGYTQMTAKEFLNQA